jgi:hypothetical protein
VPPGGEFSRPESGHASILSLESESCGRRKKKKNLGIAKAEAQGRPGTRKALVNAGAPAGARKVRFFTARYTFIVSLTVRLTY